MHSTALLVTLSRGLLPSLCSPLSTSTNPFTSQRLNTREISGVPMHGTACLETLCHGHFCLMPALEALQTQRIKVEIECIWSPGHRHPDLGVNDEMHKCKRAHATFGAASAVPPIVQGHSEGDHDSMLQMLLSKDVWKAFEDITITMQHNPDRNRRREVLPGCRCAGQAPHLL